MYIAIIIIILSIFLTIKLTIKQKDSPNKKTVDENLKIIDNLSGMQFEEYFSKLLKMIGFYNINTTKGSRDYGADIIACYNNDTYAIQCKRYSQKVSSKPIGEVLRGMKMYNCSKGIVITNNYFTDQAKKEAKVCNVELWDRNVIIAILNKISKKTKDRIFDIKLNEIKTQHYSEYGLKELSINEYKEMARKIQIIYYELGYKVAVVDINTKNKYNTVYKVLYEKDVDIFSVSDKVMEKLERENIRILNDKGNYIKIVIPLSYERL